LSDELDIVGAGVAVLVGEVEADPQTTLEGARAALLGRSGVEESHRYCAFSDRCVYVGVGEGLGFQRTRSSSSPSPSPPFNCAQRDGGPQPSVGWRPRSGREIKRARDRVSGRWTPIGVNPTKSSKTHFF
jgi:hypothetical protein